LRIYGGSKDERDCYAIIWGKDRKTFASKEFSYCLFIFIYTVRAINWRIKRLESGENGKEFGFYKLRFTFYKWNTEYKV
jgi:hypothetical protein